MKNLLLVIAIAFISNTYAQQTINASIMHDGIQRDYILYVPAIYSPGTPTPLVFNFHGYTSSATEQMFYGDFRSIADTANFLLVHPMGTLDPSNQPYWNANWGGTVDDIGFTEALLDSLDVNYNINMDRVFSTGMSNGGFMSYTLACELGDRFAAIASVTGTMNLNQSSTCTPAHPTPIMEIHGTSDGTVPYNGLAGSMESIPNVLDYWVNYNNCAPTAVETAVPNTSVTDGCTATHFIYENGDNGVDVEHYRINSGAHTWPSAPIVIGTTNFDINASEKIWEFFAKYDINGKIGTNDIIESDLSNLSISPNPTHEQIQIQGLNSGDYSYKLISMQGEIIVSSSNQNRINVAELNSGVYFIQLEQGQSSKTIKFIKQ